MISLNLGPNKGFAKEHKNTPPPTTGDTNTEETTGSGDHTPTDQLFGADDIDYDILIHQQIFAMYAEDLRNEEFLNGRIEKKERKEKKENKTIEPTMNSIDPRIKEIGSRRDTFFPQNDQHNR